MPSRFLPPRDLWGKNSGAEDLSGRWQGKPRRLNARVPRRYRRESIHWSSSLSMISVPPRLRATWSCSVGVTAKWMAAFLWWLRMWRSYRALWLTPTSCHCPLHITPESELMRSSSCHDKGCQWARARVVSTWGGISQQAGWVVSPVGLDAASLRDLRSVTGPTRHRPGHRASMSSLLVLERHLWLMMTEMKAAEKFPFLDAPVSSGSLFGPAVEGFAECFTEAQKLSQAMRHFLPKCTSSSAASSHPKPVPTQQTAKPTPATPEPWPPKDRPDRGHSL